MTIILIKYRLTIVDGFNEKVFKSSSRAAYVVRKQGNSRMRAKTNSSRGFKHRNPAPHKPANHRPPFLFRAFVVMKIKKADFLLARIFLPFYDKYPKIFYVFCK